MAIADLVFVVIYIAISITNAVIFYTADTWICKAQRWRMESVSFIQRDWSVFQVYPNWLWILLSATSSALVILGVQKREPGFLLFYYIYKIIYIILQVLSLLSYIAPNQPFKAT